MTEQECKTFSKNDTYVTKGIAILLMLFHHVFFNTFVIDGVHTELTFILPSLTRLLCKYGNVCVAIFSTLSGYGIYKQLKKYDLKEVIVKREIKLLGTYIPIFVLSSLIYIINNNSPNEGGIIAYLTIFGLGEYNSVSIIFRIIINMFGLNALFHMPTLNPSWWYLSVAHIINFVLPIFIKIAESKRIKNVVLAIIVVYCAYVTKDSYSYQGGFSSNLMASYFGYYIGTTEIFERSNNITNSIAAAIFFACATLLDVSLLETLDTYFCFSIMGICLMIFVKYFRPIHIEIIEKPLSFFGKHSGTMYMIHNFVIDSFLHFPMKYAAMVYVLVLLVTLLISAVVDRIFGMMPYKRFLNKMQNKTIDSF